MASWSGGVLIMGQRNFQKGLAEQANGRGPIDALKGGRRGRHIFVAVACVGKQSHARTLQSSCANVFFFVRPRHVH
jgi:hypothetical protein